MFNPRTLQFSMRLPYMSSTQFAININSNIVDIQFISHQRSQFEYMGTSKNWASSSRDESIGRAEAGLESAWKKKSRRTWTAIPEVRKQEDPVYEVRRDGAVVIISSDFRTSAWQGQKNNPGRKPIDGIVIFKMLVLQQLYNITSVMKNSSTRSMTDYRSWDFWAWD